LAKSTRRPAAKTKPATPRLRFSAAAAYRHLRETDPILGALIDEHGPYTPRPSPDPYGALVRSIFFQQLTGAAASAIMRRTFALFGDAERPPQPSRFLAADDDDLRAAGLSRQKISYLRDLEQHMLDGRLDFEALAGMDDAAVIAHLAAVRGIGEWSAHMFLMFHLGRPDVLPVGDLAVRNGMAAVYKLRKSPTPKRALVIGKPWAPYRSVGAWYMWRAVEAVTPD
jgi:DNA-3-methyladenine glycosylase II